MNISVNVDEITEYQQAVACYLTLIDIPNVPNTVCKPAVLKELKIPDFCVMSKKNVNYLDPIKRGAGKKSSTVQNKYTKTSLKAGKNVIYTYAGNKYIRRKGADGHMKYVKYVF